MSKKHQQTLSIGLAGFLVFVIGAVRAADTAPQRLPNVLHEMVPHVVLPESIQYDKTAKNLPGMGYSGVHSPYVATYVASPSYQVPPRTEFRSVGQSVYPVSPPQLPKPVTAEAPEPEDAVKENVAWQDIEGRDIVLTDKVAEPIRLVGGTETVVPVLPMPGSGITQTGIFCQHPASPPSAWAFSSPIFKVASVPSGWGGQAGSIIHSSPKGSGQQVGFMPVGGVDPETGTAIPQGVPYSTFQMGRPPEQGCGGVQAQLLPNGMVLLTIPPDHANCGLIRCRTGNAPRNLLLPPAGYGFPQGPQTMMPMLAPAIQNGLASGGFGTPFVPAAAQQPPMMMPPMQTAPMIVMTPMGPAVVGYQQVPAMNPMMGSPMLQQMQAVSMPSPAVAAAASNDNSVQTPAQNGSTEIPMALIATPFGYYAVQATTDAAPPDAAAQMAQGQAQFPPQMMANPYAGFYSTPFGYVAANQPGQFGGFGMAPMMNVGYQPGACAMGQGGMTVSDMLQVMTFLNNNKSQQRRARLADRLADRRERRTSNENDPFTQLMQAWATPYVTPDTTLRMPSRNAYPYGYFGVQASPADTANYGGYHNLYFGSTAYPGLY